MDNAGKHESTVPPDGTPEGLLDDAGTTGIGVTAVPGGGEPDGVPADLEPRREPSSADDDSSVGVGSHSEDELETDRGVEEGSAHDEPKDPVGEGGAEPSGQRHHDAETEEDSASGGSAESEAENSPRPDRR